MHISKIQKRLMNIIGRNRHPVYDRVLGFVLLNGASILEMTDDYHIALWLEGAPAEVKREFLDRFDEGLDGGLRICSNCGRWMTEGYYLDGDYACSDECGISIYQRGMYDADSPDHNVSREQAERQMRFDLKVDDEQCIGECYYTEW